MTESHALKGHTVLFTGKLASAKHRQAHDLVKSAGGVPVDNLSKKVTLVVVGMLGWALADGKVSAKLLKAEALQQQGQALEIISEAVLLRRLGEQSDDGIASQWQASGTVAQAAQLLNVDETLIRRWAQFGLIEVRNDHVDFQDLVSLRAIAKLIQDGLSTKQLAKALSELHRVVPDLHRPFAQARIIQENGQDIVVELQGIKMTTHGQLLLDFDAHAAASPQKLQNRKEPSQVDLAWQWVEEGLSFEEEQNWSEAQRCYQQAIELAPDLAEAHYYLANVFRERHKYDLAVDHYKKALAINSHNADALYNLAYTLDELNRTTEAIKMFKQVVEMDSEYTDAHFNLARLLVRSGKPQEAVEYWKHYLHHDSTSDWAKIAKRNILCHETQTQ
jgi:tetratricopeptide (TPR) repeat protein